MHPPGFLAEKKEPNQGFCPEYTLMGIRGQVEALALRAGLGPALFPVPGFSWPSPQLLPWEKRQNRTGWLRTLWDCACLPAVE